MSTTSNATALEWHLAFNFYPALVPQLVEPCQAAIKAIREGDSLRAIDINGTFVPAERIAEDLHLYDFLHEAA
jgi:hypothetical protein